MNCVACGFAWFLGWSLQWLFSSWTIVRNAGWQVTSMVKKQHGKAFCVWLHVRRRERDEETQEAVNERPNSWNIDGGTSIRQGNGISPSKWCPMPRSETRQHWLWQLGTCSSFRFWTFQNHQFACCSLQRRQGTSALYTLHWLPQVHVPRKCVVERLRNIRWVVDHDDIVRLVQRLTRKALCIPPCTTAHAADACSSSVSLWETCTLEKPFWISKTNDCCRKHASFVGIHWKQSHTEKHCKFWLATRSQQAPWLQQDRQSIRTVKMLTLLLLAVWIFYIFTGMLW